MIGSDWKLGHHGTEQNSVGRKRALNSGTMGTRRDSECGIRVFRNLSVRRESSRTSIKYENARSPYG